jgi:hypothetical protein
VCANGRDDDGDGLMDCEDPACLADPTCDEVCTDGVDGDSDGDADCADPDCATAEVCRPYFAVRAGRAARRIGFWEESGWHAGAASELSVSHVEGVASTWTPGGGWRACPWRAEEVRVSFGVATRGEVGVRARVIGPALAVRGGHPVVPGGRRPVVRPQPGAPGPGARA